MNIRTLTEHDLDAYWHLRLRALQDSPEAFGATYEETVARGKQSMLGRLGHDEGAFTLGAFEGEELVGTVRFQRENGPKERHKAYVYGMYVAPEMRGQGAGKALMQRLISLAEAMPG